MCKVTREKKKEEAIKRMKVLGLFKPCIKSFEKYDELQLTEPTGGLYEFGDNAELNSKIKEFEEEYNANSKHYKKINHKGRYVPHLFCHNFTLLNN